MQKSVYEYISQQTNDSILERKICKASGEEFPIYQKERELLDKISPIIGGKKYTIQSPSSCYRIRMLKRLSFRNEKKFYQVTCSKTGKKEISIVHDTVRKVMNPKDRNEEDFSQYGISYSGNFEEDLKKLFENVPYMSRFVVGSENSDYCNQAWNEKNCYLCVGGQNSENCMYVVHDAIAKYAFDCYGAINSEIVYQSVHIFNSMKSFFSSYLLNCYNVRFGFDCKSCKNVLFGIGLNGSEYVFKNKVYPKEEREIIFSKYSQKIKTISGLNEIMQEYKDFFDSNPHIAAKNTNAENSFGTGINNSKNMIFGFSTMDNNDSFYCGTQGMSQNVIDVDASSNSDMIYNCMGSLRLFSCLCIAGNFSELRNSYYDFYTRGGNNLLGCFGLNNKSYYILNKEYSKDERESLASKIIEELQSKGKRGDFFDTEVSPFPYNDTLANKFFPIRQVKIGNDIKTINSDGIGTVEILDPDKFISDALLDFGGKEKLKIKRRTKELELNIPENATVIDANNLPNNIDNVDESVLQKVIICKKTGRPFRIMKLELEFYKQYGLPLPTEHYEYREEQRYKLIPARSLDLIKCDKCGKDTISEPRKEHKYKVYCESCYNKEIYG